MALVCEKHKYILNESKIMLQGNLIHLRQNHRLPSTNPVSQVTPRPQGLIKCVKPHMLPAIPTTTATGRILHIFRRTNYSC